MEDDDWDILDDDDPDAQETDRGVPVPRMRAVYARKRLTVTTAFRRLVTDGDLTGMAFDDRSDHGVSILELGETKLDGYGWELTVGFLADGDRAAAEQAIETWSSRVGYRRVWFPDRIYEPATPPRVASRASVECPTCRHIWRGRGRRFWKQVWSVRLFPNLCPLCASTLPQWKVQRRAAIPREAHRDRLRRQRSRRVEVGS